MSETYAIELKNITKRFGKVTANDKVCLSVKKGEILSILGENGSGKTSVLKALGQFMQEAVSNNDYGTPEKCRARVASYEASLRATP